MSNKMTPCEKLGYKVGDKFKASKSGAWFSVGEEVELGRDDGSHYPYFFNERMPKDGDGGLPRHIESVEKISNAKLKPAKQALADAIHQNGGWARECHWMFAASDGFGSVFCWTNEPKRSGWQWIGGGKFTLCCEIGKSIQNWHQCVLSRDEYFTAYPEQMVEAEMKSESEVTIKASDWHKNGELPPVGAFVDVVGDDLMYGQGERNREVIAHVENTAVIRMGYGLGCFAPHALAPAKSERDWAIDEIISTAKKIGWNSEMASQIIGEVAVELYEAGYRKEVK